ncbi:MAG: nitroreductase family deazaflavin-dependent oxidoreductase [Candidatus Limnocylindria bacterium]
MANRLIVAITRLSSPITLRLAGSGLIPVWGVLHHRGRKSGKAYATPLAILGTPDGFVLPLPFGEGTDWCRNVRAGGGVIYWRGADHKVGQSEIIDAAVAMPAFNAVLRRIVRVVGIKKFLRVRRAVAQPTGPM